jgi:hypothetical protein
MTLTDEARSGELDLAAHKIGAVKRVAYCCTVSLRACGLLFSGLKYILIEVFPVVLGSSTFNFDSPFPLLSVPR